MLAQIFEWSQGNPGALTCLMDLIKKENMIHSLPIVLKLTDCTSIRGTNLYVLWSDLCGKDFEKMSILCKNCPNDILENACSRQDYSGRELVKDYF